MAKYYYHPIYSRSEEALQEVQGQWRDIAAATRVSKYLQDRACYFRVKKELAVVTDGDVLTVDGHGVGEELPHGAGYAVRGRITVPGRWSKSPSWIARQLKRDGLRNGRYLIKFFPCLTALETRYGGPSTASALARALGYRDVVVQGYLGTTFLTDYGRRVNPTGNTNDLRPAHLHRKYYDFRGEEISVERAREISGDQVARKDRAIVQEERPMIDL